MESTQKKLSRVRSPRVHITYDVEIGNAIVQRELPLIVGILADLSGSPAEPLPVLKERDFVEIDRDNFDEVMEGFVPRLTMKVADSLSEEEGATTNIELLFKSINDFSPLNLVRSIPKTNEIYQARIHLRDFLAKLDGNDALDELLTQLLSDEALQTEVKGVYADQEDLSAVEPSEFISKLLEEGGMALDESQRSYALTLVGQFALDILGQEASDSAGDAADRMNDRISQIDNLLTQQINLVMHDEGFQKLEATWRGLHYLVMNTETSTRLKLRVLNVSKRDLLKDLQKASEFDQSALFKKVYEDEFGTYGGDPFSVLVGDYEFGRHPEDIELLEKLSGVAAAAHAPFIAAAYAKLFDLQDYFRLSQPRDLSKIFESAELIKWRSFRDSEDSRYVTLTLPKVLLRLPYGPDTVVVDGFDFKEDVDGTDASRYLWGNPAFILGQRITNAFSKFGWLAAIRGVEGGGLVEGLPAHTFRTAAGDVRLTCPTQVAITDRREKELNDLGFMAILHCKGTDKAAFFGGQTTNQPKKYNTDEANANARTSAMMPYILNASRFAHYIKVIMRDKVGSFLTKDNVSDYLNTWIASYVLIDDGAVNEIKARYPLREARIDVTDVPGKPGSYKATVFLKPHFQLEELSASIRLVADIPG
ncbi:type VI secretion system contractile sheath large subunit [Thalassolituus alkanivorans]|uniref:type VI secretion system contractile sheath large subunit n=1 Tax=Thalassolituus alkanivorans TaxID=2881055 RepID=UPI001E33273A|nr:type VI secretion system contractile sheath large subunit [Thalassolituus alkanivorans]MCB2387826.1 type VI secretion system contractile sheath large subunit [Thalassolituus alkanivorans]MCB2422352.1 type VI secretion system contractile sheath large subunit [Thalassolituus alkanivorans]